MRCLAVALLVLATLAPSFADEPSPEAAAKEALRLRLVAAMDGQPRIHHAMEWQSRKEGEDTRRLFTETFREGDRAGIRARGEMLGNGHDLLFVTDGRVCVCRVAGVDVLGDLPGARSTNDRLRPFDLVRGSLGKRWGVSLARAPRRVLFDLHLQDDEGLALKFGFRVTSTTAPGTWLEPLFLGTRALLLEETEGTARIVGKNFEGRIGLRDGLPVWWNGRNPATRAETLASTALTEWTAERWRTEIDGICDSHLPNFWSFAGIRGTERQVPFMDGELGLLLRDASAAVPALSDDEAKLHELAAEAVAADLECEEMTAVPLGLSLEAWKGKVTERVRGVHQAVEIGLGTWDAWKREPLANRMVDALRRTADRLWRERVDRAD